MRTTKPRITTRANPAGSVSFCVDGGIYNGRRYRRFFPTKHEAETHAKQIQQSKRQQGALFYSLSPEQTVEAARAYELVKGVGSSLTEAVDFYLKHAKPRNGQKLTQDVVQEFLQIKTRNGFKTRYVRGLTFFYGKFVETFGNDNIGEIARARLEEWIHSQNVSPLTKCGYIRDLNMVFQFAKDEGYSAENPVSRITKPRVEETAVEIFSVDQAASILFAAKQLDRKLVPYIAIGLFAGLRSSELELLDWEEIKLPQRLIEVKAAKSKTGRHRLVTISDNLLAWLEPHDQMNGPIVQPGWRDRLQKLVKRFDNPDFKWPRNGLRHSFGSYHLVFHQKAESTALEMGHETTKMLFAHYRAVVTKEQAARYWNILPPVKGEEWMMRPPQPANANNSKTEIASKIIELAKAM